MNIRVFRFNFFAYSRISTIKNGCEPKDKIQQNYSKCQTFSVIFKHCVIGMIYAVPCMNGSTRAKNASYRLIIIAPRFLNLVQDFLTCWSRLKLTSLLLSSWNKTVPKFQCPFSVHPWLTYVKQKKRLKFSWSDFGRSMYNKNSQNMENRAKINGRIQNVQKLQIKYP